MEPLDCFSEYRLERFHLKVIAQDELARMNAHIEQCARCQRHLEEIESSWEQPDRVGAEIPTKVESQSVLSWFRVMSIATGAAVCGLGLMLAPIYQMPPQNALPVAPGQRSIGSTRPLVKPVVRPLRRGHRQAKKVPHRWIAKGSNKPSLVVAREWQGQVRQAVSGEVFREGVRLRLAYRWRRGGHVFVVHRDASGQLSPLYPGVKDGRSIALPDAKTYLLPGSLLVEGKAQGDEEILSCFSLSPLTMGEIQASLQHPRAKQSARCVHWQRFVLKR